MIYESRIKHCERLAGIKADGVFAPSVPQVGMTTPQRAYLLTAKERQQLFRLAQSSLERCMDRNEKLETRRSFRDKAQQKVSQMVFVRLPCAG